MYNINKEQKLTLGCLVFLINFCKLFIQIFLSHLRIYLLSWNSVSVDLNGKNPSHADFSICSSLVFADELTSIVSVRNVTTEELCREHGVWLESRFFSSLAVVSCFFLPFASCIEFANKKSETVHLCLRKDTGHLYSWDIQTKIYLINILNEGVHKSILTCIWMAVSLNHRIQSKPYQTSIYCTVCSK